MKQTLLISTLITLTMLSGCASKMQAPQNSGFFKSYDDLKTSNVLVSDAKELRKNIYIEDVTVIPSIDINEQTDVQKKLYAEISKYATARLKEALKFKNTDTKTKDSLVMQSALSASEVHFDDKEWNQLSPLALGITVVSLNAYLDESARLVGEYRLLNNNKTVVKSLNLVKNVAISLNGDYLSIDDLKNSIDAWVESVASELNAGDK